MSQEAKPWGGRFTEATDAFVEAFTASVSFDQRLYHHDIEGSIAHASMLAIVGVLIVLPVLEGSDLEMWRMVLTAVLLTLCSVVFLAVSFVKEDGRLKWRWSK